MVQHSSSVSEHEPYDFANAIAEQSRNPLKFMGILVLSLSLLLALPFLAIRPMEAVLSAVTQSKVSYFESGKALGQTREQLDRRFGEGASPLTSTSTRSYLLGMDWAFEWRAYVTFDPETDKAITAEVTCTEW